MVDANDWSTEGRNILTPDRLAAIRNVLENVGPVIVEHWFYYERRVIEDYEEFMAYLESSCKPGDALHVWDYAHVCSDATALASGKYPDSQGRVPRGGAY